MYNIPPPSSSCSPVPKAQTPHTLIPHTQSTYNTNKHVYRIPSPTPFSHPPVPPSHINTLIKMQHPIRLHRAINPLVSIAPDEEPHIAGIGFGVADVADQDETGCFYGFDEARGEVLWGR